MRTIGILATMLSTLVLPALAGCSTDGTTPVCKEADATDCLEVPEGGLLPDTTTQPDTKPDSTTQPEAQDEPAVEPGPEPAPEAAVEAQAEAEVDAEVDVEVDTAAD